MQMSSKNITIVAGVVAMLLLGWTGAVRATIAIKPSFVEVDIQENGRPRLLCDQSVRQGGEISRQCRALQLYRRRRAADGPDRENSIAPWIRFNPRELTLRLRASGPCGLRSSLAARRPGRALGRHGVGVSGCRRSHFRGSEFGACNQGSFECFAPGADLRHGRTDNLPGRDQRHEDRHRERCAGTPNDGCRHGNRTSGVGGNLRDPRWDRQDGANRLHGRLLCLPGGTSLGQTEGGERTRRAVYRSRHLQGRTSGQAADNRAAACMAKPIGSGGFREATAAENLDGHSGNSTDGNEQTKAHGSVTESEHEKNPMRRGVCAALACAFPWLCVSALFWRSTKGSGLR